MAILLVGMALRPAVISGAEVFSLLVGVVQLKHWIEQRVGYAESADGGADAADNDEGAKVATHK